MLKGKKILLGITGSIAAYKTILLTRLLIKEGAEVKVVMTPAAKDFVPSLTLSTLSRNPILIDLFEEKSWANHVMLGRWADIMLIAPLSCNTLAKMAQGNCDNLLMAIYLSATCPVVVAPAMDEDMWRHPATKRNLATLHEYGNKVIPVEKGDLASGLLGEGRMAEPEIIFDYITSHFFLKPRLSGKKAIVTAGPTYEAHDPVRFIGNHSSGKMGLAIAKELSSQGAEVTLILGPSPLPFTEDGFTVTRVTSASEMYDQCIAKFSMADIAVMAAAVADYSPAIKKDEKIKKKDDRLMLELVKTKDILKTLGGIKRDGQVLVGFALETNNEELNALEKLKTKNADMIVLNSLKEKEAGFGIDTNKVTIFNKDGQRFSFPAKSKSAVAKDIIDTLIRLYYE